MSQNSQYCLLLDLVDDSQLIAEYEAFHQAVWPEIKKSIIDAGIQRMEIYRIGNRLAMFIETTPEFSFQKKAAMDRANPKVQEWESLMWKYQQALPIAKEGEKWLQATKLFSLSK